jgi:hypothetical protein
MQYSSIEYTLQILFFFAFIYAWSAVRAQQPAVKSPSLTSDAIPDAPIVSEVARCGEGVVTFSVIMGNNKGEGVRLYTTPKEGTPINVTQTPPFELVTPEITTHTLFYLEVYNKEAVSKRTAAWAKVYPLPQLPALPRSVIRCVGDTLRIAIPPQPQVTFFWKGPNGYAEKGEVLFRKLQSAKEGGTYVLQSVSEKGCSSGVAKIKVYIKDSPPVPEITYYNDLGQTVPLCKGDNLNLYILNYWDLPPGTQFIWHGPDGAVYKHPFPIIRKVAAGNYYVVAHYGKCSSTSEKIQVRFSETILPPPTPYNNSPLCEGSSYLELKVNPVPGAVQYLWNGPNNFSATGAHLQLPAHQKYRGIWFVTAINAEGCASAEGATEVKIFSKKLNLVLEAQANTPVCEGQPIKLSAKQYPGIQYTWLGPNNFKYTGTSPAFEKNGAHAADAGAYTLTAMASGCATVSSVINIHVIPENLIEAIEHDAPKCENQNLNLKVSNFKKDYSYYWQGPGGFSATGAHITRKNVKIADAGAYSVVARYGGCMSEPKTVYINIRPIPQNPTVENNGPRCIGENLLLKASYIAGAEYSWSGPEGFSATGNTVQRKISSPGNEGFYKVQIKIPGCNSLYLETRFSLRKSISPPLVIYEKENCLGKNLTLKAEGLPGAIYTWSGPQNFSATGEEVTRKLQSLSMAGVYSVATRLGECTAETKTFSIVVKPKPKSPVIQSNLPVCTGQELILETDTFSQAKYLWLLPGGKSHTAPILNIPNAGRANNGAYRLVVYKNGCASDTTELKVNINPLVIRPKIKTNSPICAGQDLVFSVSPIAGARYAWSGPKGFASTESAPVIAKAQPQNSGKYLLTLTVSKCAVTTVAVETYVHSPNTPIEIKTNSPVCLADSLKIEVTAFPGASYSWKGPNNFTSTKRQVVITKANTFHSGNYAVNIEIGKCNFVKKAAVTIIPKPPTPLIRGVAPVCSGDTVALEVVKLAKETQDRYYWEGPANFSATGASVALMPPIFPGVYTVKRQKDGCYSNPAKVSVQLRSGNVTLSAQNNGPICKGQTLQLTATAITGATYIWRGPGGFTSTERTPVLKNAYLSGNYRVEAIVRGCLMAAVTSVQINAPSIRFTTGKSAFCDGNAAYIELEAQGTPPWKILFLENGESNTLEMPESPFVLPISSGSNVYRLIQVTDAQGCTALAEGSLETKVHDMPDAHIVSVSPVEYGSAAKVKIAVSGLSSPTNWLLKYVEGKKEKSISGTGNGEFTLSTGLLRSSTFLQLLSITNIESEPACSRILTNAIAAIKVYPGRCQPVLESTLKNISITSALVDWEPTPTAPECYIFSFGPLSVPAEKWKQYTVNSNFFLMSDLLPATEYGYRIRASCNFCNIKSGVRSPWSPIRYFTTNTPTLLQMQEMEDELQVFPNPSEGPLKVSFDFQDAKQASVRVSNATGVVLLETLFTPQIGRNTLHFDLSNLPEGVYNIQLIQGNLLRMVKIMLSK